MSGTKFSPKLIIKKKTRPHYCSVSGCNSNSGKNRDLSFHAFPRLDKQQPVKVKNYFGDFDKINRCDAWKRALKIKTVNKRAMVCSLHFNYDDYTKTLDPAKSRHILKKNAVPSCNLPTTYEESPRDKRYGARLRQKEKEENNIGKNSMDLEMNVEDNNVDSTVESVFTIDKVDINVNEIVASTSATTSTTEPTSVTSVNSVQATSGDDYFKAVPRATIGVQVSTTDFQPRFMTFIQNERQLSTITGINSFKTIDCIVELVEIAFGPQLKNIISTRMDLYDRVIMTYMKLKQNFSYAFLAIVFPCYTTNKCKTVFYEMIDLLSETLKFAIKWPSKETVSKNMPLCFAGFEDVRVVLDCTEISLQKPKEQCCQVLTNSTYKKVNTGKIMTGISPDGCMVYISKAWGGKTSDTHIFENSELINLLEPGDAIMVDKGFFIDEICAENRWKLVRPPFLSNKKQKLSKAAAVETAQIAKARVHIERYNARIKTFKIVEDTMPAGLVKYLDDIFLIICATINISSPILKDKYFMKQNEMTE